MTDLEAIWKRARCDLTLTTPDGHQDIFLWEHSERVAKSVKLICRLPEVRCREPDLVAAAAAALYHDAGWVTRWRNGEVQRFEILLSTPSENLLADSVRLLEFGLSKSIPSKSLETARQTILMLNQRSAYLVEGEILADADNLEEFGLGFVWMAIRRGVCDGKGIQAVLDAWRRRVEYQFWNARLKEAFHFEATRKLARIRLRQVEALIAELNAQHQVEDLCQLVAKESGMPA